jgi:hypothetical protein
MINFWEIQIKYLFMTWNGDPYFFFIESNLIFDPSIIRYILAVPGSNVSDLDPDPDPYLWLTDPTPGPALKIKGHKEVTKQVKIKVFLHFLLVDGSIRMRSRFQIRTIASIRIGSGSRQAKMTTTTNEVMFHWKKFQVWAGSRSRVTQLVEYTSDVESIVAGAKRTLVSLLDSAEEKPLGTYRS